MSGMMRDSEGFHYTDEKIPFMICTEDVYKQVNTREGVIDNG